MSKPLEGKFCVRKIEECPMMGDEEVKKSIAKLPDAKLANQLLALVSNPNLEWHRLADSKDSNGRFGVDHIRVRGGRDFPNHYHEHMVAVICIVEGKGHVIRGGGAREDIEKGDVIYIPPGEPHQFFSDGSLEYLAITSSRGMNDGFQGGNPDFIPLDDKR